MQQTTPVAGIVYYTPPQGARVCGLDGKVSLALGPEPLPLLEADRPAPADGVPGYDALGRGLYQALRTEPGCRYAERYAGLLKEGYPHYLSELASHVIMLGEKDVEVPYLDRRVKLLRIFALLEPEDPHFPLEIGATLLEKGCRFSALHLATVTLYQAESYLERALELSAGAPRAASTLAEVCFLLGKYQKAASLWRELRTAVAAPVAAELDARLEKIDRGELPRVPAVDYLEAIAGALSLQQEGAFGEAAAILADVLADRHFCGAFPLPEVPYLLALCCRELGNPEEAQGYLQQALSIDPDFGEALSLLEKKEP